MDLLENRLVFFTCIAILQVAFHVTLGLSMYGAYLMAHYLFIKALDLLPNRLVANLWQVALVFVVLGRLCARLWHGCGGVPRCLAQGSVLYVSSPPKYCGSGRHSLTQLC